MDERDTLQQIEEFLQRQLENRTGDVSLYGSYVRPAKNDSVFKDLTTLDSLLKDVADLVGNITDLHDEIGKLRDRIQKIEERLGGRQEEPVERPSEDAIGESLIKTADTTRREEPSQDRIAIEKAKDQKADQSQSREVSQLRDRVNWVVIQVMQLFAHVGELFRRDARRVNAKPEVFDARIRDVARRAAREAVDAKLQELLQADVKNIRDMLGRILAQQRFIMDRFRELTQEDQNLRARMAFVQRQIDMVDDSILQVVRGMLNDRMTNVARDMARLWAEVRNAELAAEAASGDALVATNVARVAHNKSVMALNTASAALREAMLAHRRISASGVFE